jgi:hypothetical protein
MMNATRKFGLFFTAFLWLFAAETEAVINGLTGTSFNFTAKADHVSTGEGNSVYFWGYANGTGRAQYPGPTLIVNQGDTVTINLANELSMPVSIVFPGQPGVTATGGANGLLTMEAPLAGSVLYTFTATHAGTYLYHSGTMPELQVEMGLFGAIIVRPNGFNPSAPEAYNHEDSSYDHEVLYLMSEMDSRIHNVVEFQGVAALENTDYLYDYFPNYWFFNGRNFPDTLVGAGVPWLPTQPYNCIALMHPGEKVLKRIIGVGRDLHPHHPHGNHVQIIARYGRLLESAPGSGPDLSKKEYTVQSVPGETVDAIFTWSGKGMGWDIYGTGPGFEHECNDGNGDDFDDNTTEYCPDHGKPIPVILPEAQDLGFGGLYSGSPYLGFLGFLPPGEGGLNPFGAFTFPWHSHAEKEIINNDIFIGGMVTFVLVVPSDVPIQ